MTYWKEGEQKGCEREEGRRKRAKGKRNRGSERGDNDMLMNSKNDSERRTEESLKTEIKKCSLFNFRKAAVAAIYYKWRSGSQAFL